MIVKLYQTDKGLFERDERGEIVTGSEKVSEFLDFTEPDVHHDNFSEHLPHHSDYLSELVGIESMISDPVAHTRLCLALKNHLRNRTGNNYK